MKKEWQTKSLGDLCDIVGGGTPPKDKPAFYSGEIPWATVRDMRKDVITETEFQITKDAVKSSATNIIPSGNVVIATRVGLGKVCLTGQDTAINQDLRGIVPRSDKALVVRYLYWWLKSIADVIVAEGTGATVQGVKLPFVKSLQIPVPPLAEQQRIVELLDEAFEGLATAKANAEKNLQNARALFESHLQSVFTQRGNGWVVKPLGEVCVVKDGTHDSPKYVTDGIPFVTQKNIREDGLSFEKTKFISQMDHDDFYRRSNAAHGDILISMIGANRGMACKVDDERTFSIKNVGLVKQNPTINQEFLLYFLKSPQAASFVKGASKGGAQEFVGLTELRRFPVPLPSLERQNAFAETFQSLREETQRLARIYERKLAALSELKKSLLHQAFTGEL